MPASQCLTSSRCEPNVQQSLMQQAARLKACGCRSWLKRQSCSCYGTQMISCDANQPVTG